MSRDEFMRELEYLLSDIPDNEKADASDITGITWKKQVRKMKKR